MKTITKSFKAVIYGQANLAELGKFALAIITLLLIILYFFGSKFAGAGN
ncbi:hypothetical protein HDF18_06110 [Mucilaginibacter sp. X5P1]|nr:hypothetical protein [Mucilaginibacter sp. X5P1]MBB6137206.1 hypothetical protein [Mucilaginibacter sp. X5P1]